MSNPTTSPTRIVLSWTLVAVPLLYGVYQTLLDTVGLFGG
ncbi:MAG: MFS transporter small subunit [Nocardioidaceae bacterium]